MSTLIARVVVWVEWRIVDPAYRATHRGGRHA